MDCNSRGILGNIYSFSISYSKVPRICSDLASYTFISVTSVVPYTGIAVRVARNKKQ